MELRYVYTLFSIICLDMKKNQRHPLYQFVALCKVTQFLFSYASTYPTSNGAKRREIWDH